MEYEEFMTILFVETHNRVADGLTFDIGIRSPRLERALHETP